MVEVVLVVRVLGHARQRLDHPWGFGRRDNLRLTDVGVELQFVGRILGDGFLESAVCLGILSLRSIDLAEQIIFAGFLLLSTMFATFYGFFQMGQRLLETLVLQQVGGVERFVLVGQLVGDAVALGLGEEVLRLVVPVKLGVALCHTHTAFSHYARLVAEQTGDVGIGGGGLKELALLELCLGHQQPDVVHEGIVLLLGIPLFVFLGQCASLPFGLGFDGVELRSFLGFLDGFVEVARAHLAGGGAADDIEWNDLHVVVLVSLLLCLNTLLVGFVTVVIDVEAGDK